MKFKKGELLARSEYHVVHKPKIAIVGNCG